ncbi:cell envelope integrity protein TolA [Massilia sp. CMS3.1]|uniref:cell envelope integrity protein TolA n=1 Tax=Massilia sp. CMS3.1 TaxID=3373083 RepID=UPI003EE6A37A
MKPATHGAPYTLPPEPNKVPAIVLALAVHALLLAFLWVGISWQKAEPPAVEAEVWDMKVESAAAPALPPPPMEVSAPEPTPKPAPPPPPPRPKVAEPEPVKPAAPDINLEREKKLAEQKKQRERDVLEKKERERELAETKEREELKAKELADKKAADQKLADKKAAEKKEHDKKEAEKKLAADAEKKKLAAEKTAKAKAEAADQARLDKQRADELKRMMGAAGSGGEAQKSSAPKIDAGYVGKITALIKSNTTFAGSLDVPGNPKAVFKVEQLPTGEILSVRLSKSSGVPQFDDAVERGINKSSPLPKKKDGTVERTIVVNFSMKDLD